MSISIKRPILQRTTLDLCLSCHRELSDFDLSDKSAVALLKHTHTQCSGVCLCFYVSVYSLAITGCYLSSPVTFWRLGAVRKHVGQIAADRISGWSAEQHCSIHWDCCFRRWVSFCLFTCICKLLKRRQVGHRKHLLS